MFTKLLFDLSNESSADLACSMNAANLRSFPPLFGLGYIVSRNNLELLDEVVRFTTNVDTRLIVENTPC